MATSMAVAAAGTGGMAKKWMQKAFSKNKGKLHRELHVNPNEPIPPKKLQDAATRAEKTGNTTLAREVNAARTGARISRSQ